MDLSYLYKILNISFNRDGDYERMSKMAIEREVGEFLYYFVRLIKPEIIVETGSGFSTFLMANALKENQQGYIYSFDITGQETRKEKLRKIDSLKYVNLITGPASKRGEEIVREIKQIDILFLDAVHTYEAVIEEIEIFNPCLIKGSYLIFHDVTHPKFVGKVGKAVEELKHKVNMEGITFETINGLSILKKIGD
jgi:predicted O-methyltransferase YrrM